ncbi:MAG: acetate--CoA ligase family protein [Nitrososphaerales archaeon]
MKSGPKSAQKRLLDGFFNPRSISIVGASPERGKLGTLVVQNLIAQGYRGKIFPVNPSAKEILGIKCHKDVGLLPVVPELSIILIRSDLVPACLREHAKKGVKRIIVMSAGFKEIGPEGAKIESELIKIARENHQRLIGPNCLGIYDNLSRVDTFFVPRELVERPAPGSASIVSQSGSFAAHMMDLASFERLGIGRVITFGNKADVSERDALYYFADDRSTKVVGLYLESVTGGKEFIEAAEYCSLRKPVIVLKGGRHEETSNALMSHTGAIAGSYSIYKASFHKAFLLEVSSEVEFLDCLKAASLLPKAKGRRVLIIGHAGGMGLIAADLCISHGLCVPETSPSLSSKLRGLALSYASVRNPIDLTASGTDDQTRAVLNRALLSEDFDIGIYLALWGLPQSVDAIGEIVSSAMKRSGKPIVVATMEGRKCREKRSVFESLGVPVFPSIERAVVAASCLGTLAGFEAGRLDKTIKQKRYEFRS